MVSKKRGYYPEQGPAPLLENGLTIKLSRCQATILGVVGVLVGIPAALSLLVLWARAMHAIVVASGMSDEHAWGVVAAVVFTLVVSAGVYILVIIMDRCDPS